MIQRPRASGARGCDKLKRDIVALYNLDKDRATLGARLEQAGCDLLAGLQRSIAPLDPRTAKEQTRAEVAPHILDSMLVLPEPPCSRADEHATAKRLYAPVWQQRMGRRFGNQGLQPPR